ncbi:hypothetical protein M947_03905 [Sulfurimonas hongkongensis]|uniref:JHP0747 family n=1 Tax=Sulfurimonas hongkongensis TaxID=1172190 RepID=T0JPZ3_9BACT|nr:hypothetical protein [Sulfurimonas hongkongensis]EQB40176.1 hypothetical protein M947_03905 [Sulfurimonas hongkongensis]
MKVAVECKSPLLQKSLEIFLSSHLSSIKNSHIVVRDYKVLGDDRGFYISKDSDGDLIKPFSKSSLIMALQKKYKKISPKVDVHNLDILDENEMDFSILQRRIESLTKEYQDNVLKAVRAFYER